MRILLVVLCIIFLSACTSCAGLLHGGSSTRQQYESSYTIQTTCIDGRQHWGSAFAVSPRHLITAKHVVDCGPGNEILSIVAYQPKLNPKTSNLWTTDTVHEMVMDKFADNGFDAARLVISGASEPFKALPVSTAEPKIGDSVCTIGMIERSNASQMKKCGFVAGRNSLWIVVSIHVVSGNSGSPLFDKYGNVIGLLNVGQPNSGADFWGGFAAASDWWPSLKPDYSPSMNGEWP